MQEGRSACTANRQLLILRAILARAVRRKLIATNPAQDVGKLRQRRSTDLDFRPRAAHLHYESRADEARVLASASAVAEPETVAGAGELAKPSLLPTPGPSSSR